MELPCARCRTVIPTIAQFCPACGAGQVPAPAPVIERLAPVITPPIAAITPVAPTGPQACPGCGLLRASQRRGCDLCTISYEQPGVAIPPTGDALWVGVRCQFQCRLCGHPSPLNHLDVDGSVSCLRCGLDQVFDVGSWIEGLDHAMRCAALAGLHGTYKQLGVSATSLELVQNGMQIAGGNMVLRSLRISAGPGHPLCARCHAPLEVELDGAATKTRCPTCSATQTCELPTQAHELCSAVRGVIAEELTLDKRDAKVDNDGGASAIKCSHCAAPLKVTGVSSIVTCEYCGASSRIPRRTMFKLGHDQPVAQLWWIAFSRTAAAAATRPPPPRPVNPSPRPTSNTASVPAAKSDGLGGLAAFACVIAIGLIGYRDDLSRWVTSIGAIRSASATAPTSPEAIEPPKALAPVTAATAYHDVAGCTCRGMQLQAQDEGHALRLQAVRQGRRAIDLGVFEVGNDPVLGLGCDGDRIVIAGGSRVTGWRLARGQQLWDRSLPAPLRGAGACSVLKIVGKKVSIPIKGGTTVLDLTTGK